LKWFRGIPKRPGSRRPSAADLLETCFFAGAPASSRRAQGPDAAGPETIPDAHAKNNEEIGRDESNFHLWRFFVVGQNRQTRFSNTFGAIEPRVCAHYSNL
jgi:hypothetical protein